MCVLILILGRISLVCYYGDLNAASQRMKYSDSCSQTIVIRSTDALDLSDAKLMLGSRDFSNMETSKIKCDCSNNISCFGKFVIWKHLKYLFTASCNLHNWKIAQSTP